MFGRLDPNPGVSHYQLPGTGVRFVELPHYPRVTAIRDQLRALRSARATFADALDALDAVWIFGPHPMAVAFALSARRRNVPLVLGVRQDYPAYIRHRLPSRRWLWAVPVAHGLERIFRRLSRRSPTVALGDELARRYRKGAPVLSTTFSLVSRAEIADLDRALGRSWAGELRILTVGRIDAEKNPLLLADIVTELRRGERRWRLAVIGEGPMQPALHRRLEELGVADAVSFLGYVPSGPALWREYDESHAFLHVSLTEGLPQVLVEAQAAGLPIVATDVGSVSQAIDDGRSGLLVAPRDARAAAAALSRLAADDELRRRLSAGALERAAGETMEAQLDRAAEFIKAHAG